MGLKDWVAKKAKEKQRKNIAEASAQAFSSIQMAVNLIAERDGSLAVALESPVVIQTIDRHAERIASFSGGPMHADELWREVYAQMLSANEQMFEPEISELINGMLKKAYDHAVATAVVTSDTRS